MGFPCRCCKKCPDESNPGCELFDDGTGGASLTLLSGSGNASLSFETSGGSPGDCWKVELDAGMKYCHLKFDLEVSLDDAEIKTLGYRIDSKKVGTFASHNLLIEQDGKLFSGNWLKVVGNSYVFAPTFPAAATAWNEVISYYASPATGGALTTYDTSSHPDFSRDASPIKAVLLINGESSSLFIDNLCFFIVRGETVCDMQYQTVNQNYLIPPQPMPGGAFDPSNGQPWRAVLWRRLLYSAANSASCQEWMVCEFLDEDGEGYRYFRSEQYKTRDGTDAYMFCRVHRCRNFVIAWIATDIDALEPPEDCFDSSNYLPIWDRGVGEEEDFDPENPIDPIYVLSSDSNVNAKYRFFGLNFPRDFYRLKTAIEVGNFVDFLPSGTISIPLCGNSCDVSADIHSIPNQPSPVSLDADKLFAVGTVSPRGWNCGVVNGVGVNAGGNWILYDTPILSYGVGSGTPPNNQLSAGWKGFSCPTPLGVSFSVRMGYLIEQGWSDYFLPGRFKSFYVYFQVGGAGWIVGELNGDLGEDWSTFSNLTPINKSGGVNFVNFVLTDLVLGSFEARWVYTEVLN